MHFFQVQFQDKGEICQAELLFSFDSCAARSVQIVQAAC